MEREAILPHVKTSTSRSQKAHCSLKGTNMEIILAVVGGLLAALVAVLTWAVLLLLAAPFFKSVLLDDPDHPDKLALFTEPEPGQAITIMRGGDVDRIIHGRTKDEKVPDTEMSTNPFLRAYDTYAALFGIRFIGIPSIHTVKSYDLPRYRKTEEDGKLIYTAVKKGEVGFRSNHVRTRLTPWYYELSGVEIEGVPFTIYGAAYIYFDRKKIYDALFGVDSWNTLLTQALNATVRGTLRDKVSLDDAIGAISQDIWEEGVGNATKSEKEIADAFMRALLEFTLKDGRTLQEAIGLVIERNDILDFSPEALTPEELQKLRAPALQRRVAQGRVMEGKAEAKYQEEVLKVLAQHPELAKANVDAEAFVKAAKAGQIDALLAGLLRKLAS
jgi:hypothetical protein